ncbi:class I SAM-dependent methyltransferase [Paenibacillus sp. MER TA 81-3]|uniref:class I SAM-dependent methyltransferase n=1 Tax=Paenibacillus sp. MER TA 81-3 TaxID=2939573 RepID=UPI00203E135D|nr:class I SAM-dependent methyltransferase [Paenibacillus sp. MER TA 81-3]MCM3337587.1 class I SAM-dependent methyltransferase [Paenibacillus sp. MER TA 81-3]
MSQMINYYSSFDEWGRLEREPLEFTVNCHYIKSHLPEKGHILDIGAGPGKYAIELAKSGYDITLADITPKLVESAREKVREYGLERQFQGFDVADARNLQLYADEQFDASLMLGPLYHLQQEEDRVSATQELHRVTKSGCLVFVAFMPRMRHVATSLLYPQHWKPNDTIEGLTEFMCTGIFNHSDEGRFTGAYYFPIEEIEPFMEAHGFEQVKLIGSGSIAGLMKPEHWQYWRDQGESAFQSIMQIVMDAADSPYILGTSSHLLYIGKKV